jgi:putative ubiquitin-RnfH superfamily antitoxin RatB of RatAB toxin-antitoxin module
MPGLRVEVIYALPESADVVQLTLASGSTVGDAVKASGILERHPQAAGQKLGIYGKIVAPGTALADGDRVEIYRPLELDPKEARRRRARKRR